MKLFERFSQIVFQTVFPNFLKCEFSQSQLTFFGFVFSSEGVSPDPAKVEAIHKCSTPSSVKEVRSFLGMATYCAKFIPNFSDLTEPLRELTGYAFQVDISACSVIQRSKGCLNERNSYGLFR